MTTYKVSRALVSVLAGVLFLAAPAFASAATNTTLTVNPATGTYGGTATLSATLTTNPGGTPIQGKTIVFAVHNIPVGTATTNSLGVATLNNAIIFGVNAGTHAGYVGGVYLGGGGFIGDTSSAALTVNKKNLTVTGNITADNKTYDGTTDATVHLSSLVLHGAVLGDALTLHSTGVTGAFSDPNAGTGKTVQISGLTVTGSGVSNYTLVQPTTTADIIPTQSSSTVVIRAADLDNTSSSPAAVRADGLNKWFEYNDTTDTIDNTLGTFVTGPATAPAGVGSIEFKLGANPLDRKNIATYQFAGTLLSQFTSLSFSAYSHSGVAGATESPYLNFNVDFTGSNAFQGRLVYVPSSNGAVPQDQWNTFDAINSGNALWTWSKFASNGNKWPDGNTSQYRTWSSIKSAFPNAGVLSTDSWFGVRVGEPGPTNYVGDVDNVSVGILSNSNIQTTTFDFEPTAAPSCNGSTTFDTFNLGSVNGQGGWGITGGYDQAVVSNTYGFPTFGCQTLRISDSVASGSFGDQLFSPSITNEAGESDALNGGYSGGVRQNHFVATFDLASAQALGLQPGMHLSVSPDRGDGARMSYLRFEDHSASDVYTADTAIPGHPAGSHYDAGINVFFDDVQGTNVGFEVADFEETEIATLDRTKAHTITFDMTFVDGASNDIVKIYIDGNLVHTGTSWENYYRFDTESQGYPTIDPSLYNKSRTVDSLLFRESGDADAANAGKGFLIDNVALNSSTATGTLTITNYACPVGTAPTRAANGVGQPAPSGCVPEAGTIFGYVHGTQTDANPPYPELGHTFTVIGSPDNTGVLSANLSPLGRYLVAETDASGNQLPANAPLGLYCTGDGDTSGNNDNQELTFVPVGGTVNCVAYNQIVDTTAPTATFKFPTPGPAATSFQVTFSEPVNQTEAIDPANYFLNNWPGAAGSGPLTGNATVSYDSGTNTATVTFTNAGWYVSPEQQWGVQDVQDLAGNTLSPNPTTAYSSPLVPPTAPGTPTTATPTTSTSQDWVWAAATDPTDPTNASGVASYSYEVTDNNNADAVVVATTTVGNALGVTTDLPIGSYTFHVWAIDNAGNVGPESTGSLEVDAVVPPPPATVTVTIDKYINGVQATAANTDSTSFPMHAIFPGGEGDYNLSTSGYNNSDPYKATTSDMPLDSAYNTYEISPESCTATFPYKLVGYTEGDTLADAAEATPTLTVPNFTDLTSSQFVIVWNDTCPPPPVHQSPANGAFLTTAQLDHIDWSDVTDWSLPMSYDYEVSYANTTNTDGSFTAPINIGTAGTGLTDSQILTPGTPDGTYYWHVRAVDAAGHSSAWTTPWSVTVDNDVTPPPAPPAPIHVHIFKYLDNNDGGSAQIPDDSDAPTFPMIAVYSIAGVATNLDPGNAYNLGDYGSNTGDNLEHLKYAADTIDLSAGDIYGTHEVVDTDESPVVANVGECSTGKYYLEGYKVGDTLEAAQSAGLDTESPYFNGITSDKYVIVVNNTCSTPAPVAPTLTIVKDAVGGDGTFGFTVNGIDGTEFSKSLNLTTLGEATSSDVITLEPGTYDVEEPTQSGWNFTSVSCVYNGGGIGEVSEHGDTIDVDNGDSVVCTFTNTKQVVETPASADLSIVKTIDNSTPNQGDTVTYTIKVTNDGPDTASGVSVADSLPDGLSLVSSSADQGSYSGDTWDIGSLESGTTTTLTIIETVNSETAGDTITNSATVSEDEDITDSDSDNNTSSASLVVNTPEAPADTTPPTVVLSTDSTSPTNDSPVHVTATFSEAIDASTFTIDDVATGDSSRSNLQSTSNPLVYTFDVTPTGPGTVTVIIPEHQLTDLAGNQNTASNQLALVFPIPSNPTPTFTSFSSGGSGLGHNLSIGDTSGGTAGGQVLGAETGPAVCSQQILNSYMRMGGKNDPSQVKLLQAFLNGELGTHVPITGFFGAQTTAAVKQFQLKYAADILTPWGLTQPTGWVYKFTERKINLIYCGSLNIPVPTPTIDPGDL